MLVDTDGTLKALYKFIKKHAKIPFKIERPASVSQESVGEKSAGTANEGAGKSRLPIRIRIRHPITTRANLNDRSSSRGAWKAEAFVRWSSSSRTPFSIGSFGDPAYGGSRMVAPRRSPRCQVRLDLEEKSKSASARALEQFKISADRKPLAHSFSFPLFLY
ncbi:hypothetical protein B296_00036923 [Ensete ventricosum]|uniref:Uncharacterized protein n=1 Tax=Ensete ventricosum TaxID=4639 RepID=A0A426XWQ9_ENSVE|nr:hypothetical protein B296_00036923 [Ensete ventricosum]